MILCRMSVPATSEMGIGSFVTVPRIGDLIERRLARYRVADVHWLLHPGEVAMAPVLILRREFPTT